MKKFFVKLKKFLTEVAHDERIPVQDKKVLVVMLALLISPLDLIPDWIHIFGLLDDLIVLALMMDYIFEVLDQSILLSHYPWGMKSFARIRRMGNVLSFFVPNILKNNIWNYKRDPF